MDISFLRQHRLCRLNDLRRIIVVINMNNVGATAGTAGVVIGAEAVTASISSNTVTLTYVEPLEAAPYVDATIQSGNSVTNAAVDITTQSTTQLVFSCVTRDSHGTGITNAIVLFEILVPVGLTTI